MQTPCRTSLRCDHQSVELRRYRDQDREPVWRLHQVALEQAGGHLSGPWDDDLTMIRAGPFELVLFEKRIR